LTTVYGHTALRPAANIVTLVFRPVYEMTVTSIERVHWCMRCMASADLLSKQCDNMVILLLRLCFEIDFKFKILLKLLRTEVHMPQMA